MAARLPCEAMQLLFGSWRTPSAKLVCVTLSLPLIALMNSSSTRQV